MTMNRGMQLLQMKEFEDSSNLQYALMGINF